MKLVLAAVSSVSAGLVHRIEKPKVNVDGAPEVKTAEDVEDAAPPPPPKKKGKKKKKSKSKDDL